MTHKWASSNAWLMSKINEWDEDKVRNALRILTLEVDPEEIYVHFQDEMEADGFFEEAE